MKKATPCLLKTSSPRKRIGRHSAILAGSVAALLAGASAYAGTADNYTGSATGSLLTGSNWSLGTVPTISNDAVFTATTGIRTLSAGNLTVNSFNVTAATGTFSIQNNTTTATNSILTLGGTGSSSNLTTGAATGDLIYVALGGIFNIIGANGGGGTGLLQLALGQSGNFDIAGTSTISAAISGDFGFTKTGTGTLTLSGANTYTGLTTVSAGVLRITNSLSLGTTAGGVAQSGTSALEIDGTGGAVTVGAEALSINGGGITNLGALRNIAGNNTYGGTVTMAAQSRINSDSGTLTLNNATAVTGAFTLVAGGAGNITISGAMTNGVGGLSKVDTGALTLSGANTFTGGTTLTLGTLNINSVGVAGTSGPLGNGGTFVINGGTVDNTSGAAKVLLNVNPVTIGGSFAFSTGAGTALNNLTLPGAATLSTSQTITANGTGTLAFGGTFALGGTGNTLTKTGAGTLTLNGVVSGTKTVNTTALQINGGTVAVVVNTNTFNGDIAVDGATSVFQVATGASYTTTSPFGTVAGGTSYKQMFLTNGGTFRLNGTGTFNDNIPTATNIGAGIIFNIGTGGGVFDVASGATLLIDDGTTGTGTATTASQLQGSGTLTKAGLGNFTWNNLTAFTGNIIVSAGTLQPSGATAFGTGAGTTSVLSGATLNVAAIVMTNAEALTLSGTGLASAPVGALTASGAGTWVGPITIAAAGATIGGGAGALTLSPTATINGTAGNTRLATGAGALTVNGTINIGSSPNVLTINHGGGRITTAGVISGTGSVNVTGSTGDYVASGAHTYTGGTTLNAGSTTAISVSSTGTAGSPTNGPFGAGPTPLVLNGGQLRSGNGTPFTIGNTVTLAADTTFYTIASEKTLTFSGPVTITGASRTLTSNVGTTVAGTGVVFSGAIGDIGGFGIVKAGLGNLTFSAATNTYSGGTTVNAGLLNITGALAGTGNITVASTGYLSLIGNSANAINTTGALNLGNAAGTALIGLDLGTSSDSLAGGLAATTAGNVFFNINAVTGFGAGSYTLLSAPAGGLGGATYGLGSLPGGFTYSLAPTATNVILTVTAGAPAATNFYWGAGNSSWATNANWFSDVGGSTPAGAAPNISSTVFFSTTTATGPTITATLDAPFTIDNLTFNGNPSGVTAVTINPGNNVNNSLTLSPASSANGINVGLNNGTVTIAAPVVLGSPQTWTLNGTTGTNTSTLMVSGFISGLAPNTIAFNAANANPASITLSAVGSTYSGGSTIGANMNVVGGATNAFSPNTAWTVNGTLSTGAFAQTTGSLVGGSGIVQNGSTTSAVLTIGNDNLGTLAVPVTFASTIQNGSTGTLGITKAGTGVQELSGTLTYTGATTVTAGTLRLSNSAAPGATAVSVSGGTLQFNSANALTTLNSLALSGTGTVDLNGFSVTVGGTATGVAGNTITNSSASVTASTATTTGTPTGVFVDALNITGAQTANIAALITDGATRKTQIIVTNANGSFATGNIANTYSGGLVLANSASGTRLAPGTITGTPWGSGPIIIGQVAADKAGIFFATASQTMTNPIIFNTGLGTDRFGIRSDVAGIVLSGLITANSDAVFSSNAAGSALSITNQVTGAGGLVLDNSQTSLAGTAGLTVTLNTAANVNNYAGDTSIGRVNGTPAQNWTANLSLGAANQIPNGVGKGNVIINNNNATRTGNLLLNGFAETINGLSGNGTVDGVSGTPTLTVGDNNATASFSGIIQNTAGTLALTKMGSGTQTLSGPSTYAGLTTVNGGTLSFSTSANLGNEAATNGVNLTGGTLQYTGAGAVGLGASRQVTVTSGTTGTIEVQSVTGNLTAAGGIVTTGASAATNFTKTGPGALTVAGIQAVNLQTGGVTVTGGTLTAGLHATNTGTITVGSAGSLQLVDTSAVNLTLAGTGAGALTLNGGGRLGFELAGTTVNDSITMTGANFATASGVITLDFYSLTGFGVGLGNYNLLTAPGGLTTSGATYVLGNAPSGFNYVITAADTLISLATSLLSNRYWTNSQADVSWNTLTGGTLSNFSTDLAGNNNSAQVPQTVDTVIYSSSAASVGASPINTILDAAFTIDSLRFTAQPAGATVSIAPGAGGTLNLSPVSTANGITVDNNGGAVTISAPLTAGTSQTWSVDGTGTSSLTLSGNVTYTGNVNKTGTGTLTISGANTYTGAGNFTLAAGTLNINSASANVLGTGTFTIGAGTTINAGVPVITLTNNAHAWNGAFTFTGTNSLDLGAGAVTLGATSVITTTANILTVGGAISDGVNTFGISKVGAGTLVLNGSDTYDGPTTLSAGTLTLGGSNTLTGLVSVNAGMLNLNGNNSGAGGVTLATGATLNLNNDGALGTGTLTLNGGTIDSPIANRLTTNTNAQTWTNGANVAFTGTNTLNLGTGAVTLGDVATATFTLTNNSLLSGTSLIVGGAITPGIGGTAGTKTLLITGAGSTALTGSITKGTATGVVVTSTSTGTLTLSGSASNITSLNVNGGPASIVDVGAGTLTLSNLGANGIQSTLGGIVNATGGGTIVLGSSNGGIDYLDNGTANGTTLTINAKLTSPTFGFEIFAGGNNTGFTVLTAANTFAGDVVINGGNLRVSNIGNTGSLTSNLGAGTTININGTPSNAATATTSIFQYNGTGETTNRVVNLSGGTVGGAIEQAGTGLLKFTSNFTATGAGAKTLYLMGSTAGTGEISGLIVNSTGTTGVTKLGTGTWTLSGLSATAASNYTGTTTIDQGTLALSTTSPTLTGGLTFGAAAGSTNVGALDLSSIASTATFSGALTVQTNTASANTITLGAGKTLAITGAVTLGSNTSTQTTRLDITGGAASVLTIGGGLTTGSTGNNAPTSILNITGVNTTVTGAVTIGNNTTAAAAALSTVTISGGSATFALGGNAMNIALKSGTTTTGAIASSSTLDLSGATSVAINGTAGSSILLGSNTDTTVGTSGDAFKGTLKLSTAGTNTVSATTITLGNAPTAGNTGTQGFIVLGNAANNFSADTIYVGRKKSVVGTAGGDSITFAGNGGTWTLGGLSGAKANLNIGFNDAGTTTSTTTGKVDLTGGTFNGTLGQVVIGNITGTNVSGGGVGTLTMAAGTTTADQIQLATVAAGAVATTAGTLNLNGGTLTLAASGGGINSGTLVSGTATVNLDGGILDMGANAIGLTGHLVTLNAKSGILRNLSELNSGGTLTKTTAGTLILSGTNSYTGLTTVSAGALTVQSNTALGGTALGTSVADGAVLRLDKGAGSDLVIGAESLTLNGAGLTGSANGALRNVSGNNSFAGAITLGSASTIQSDASQTLTVSGGITNGGNLLTIQGAGNTVISSAAITGTGGLTKIDAGSLTLGAGGAIANTYAGLTTVTLGEVDLNKQAGTNAIAGNITINGGTLKLLANEQIANTSAITQFSGAFNLNGQTETIASYTKSGGNFSTGVGGKLIGTGASVFLSNGTDIINADGSIADGHVELTNDTLNVHSVTEDGAGTTGGILQINASGIGLVLNASTINLTSDADSTKAGHVLLNGNVSTAGTGLNSINSTGSGPTPGYVDLGTSGTRTFTVADTVAGAGTDLAVSAPLTNSGGLTKAGAGTLTLTGSNTFTGATVVSGGTLEAGAAGALGQTASIAVNNSGTLLLSGTGDRIGNGAGVTLGGGTLSMEGLTSQSETLGSLTLSANSTIDFGTGSGNTLTFSGLSLGGFTLSIYNWSGNPNVANPDTGADTTQDRLLFTTGNFTDAQLSQVSFYSDSGSGLLGTGREISFGSTPEIVPVPEPGTIFGALALLGLVGYRERRRFRTLAVCETV